MLKRVGETLYCYSPGLKSEICAGFVVEKSRRSLFPPKQSKLKENVSLILKTTVLLCKILHFNLTFLRNIGNKSNLEK